MESVEDPNCPMIYPFDNPVFLMDNAVENFEEQIICTYPDQPLDVTNHENVNGAEEEAIKSSSFRNILAVRVAMWPLRGTVASFLKFITGISSTISDFVYSLTANEGIRDTCAVIASVSIEVFVVTVFAVATIIASIIVNADGAYKKWSKKGRDRASETTKSKSSTKRLKEKPKISDQKAILNYVEEASKEEEENLFQHTLSNVLSEELRNHPEASFDLTGKSSKVEDNASKIVSDTISEILKSTVNAEHANEKNGSSTGTQVEFKNNELTEKKIIKTDTIAGSSEADIGVDKSQMENISIAGGRDPKDTSFESNKNMFKSSSR